MPQYPLSNVIEQQAKYYASARSGTVGWAMNPSGVTTSAALATTYVGLCLSNPVASGKSLSILNVSGAFIVAPTTVTGVALITGWASGGVTVHTTALTVGNGFVNNADVLVAKADSACTLVGTPAWSMLLSQTASATALPSFNIDVDGLFLIPPGGYIAIGTTIASPASGFQGGIMWREIAP